MARIELRLNGPKTVVLSRPEAEEYLYVTENLKLTAYQREMARAVSCESIDALYADFFHFTDKGPSGGQWDQVYRRYVGLLTRAAGVLVDEPALRQARERLDERIRNGFEVFTDYRNRKTLIRYWERQAITRELVGYLTDQIARVSTTDDVVTCLLARVLTSANLEKQPIERLRQFIDEFEWRQPNHYDAEGDRPGDSHADAALSERPGLLIALTALLAKYGTAEQIARVVTATLAGWTASNFIARQIIALWSVLNPSSPICGRLEKFISVNVQRGPLDLIDYLRGLRQLSSMPPGLEGYISPAYMKRPYTLSKAIVASNVLRSTSLSRDVRVRLSAALQSVPDGTLRGIALNTTHGP